MSVHGEQAEEVVTEIPSVTVKVSPELLKQMGEWSEPVQVKIMETPGTGTGYEMIARRVESKVST